MKQVLLTLGLLLVFALPAFAAEPNAEAVRFFETKIRPLLSEHCWACHGPAKQRGGLRLDSAQAIRKGGDSEQPVLVLDHPEKSLLLRAVKHIDGVSAMPPKTKLKDGQIADLVRWVKIGAPFPASATPVKSTGRHWAFVPPRDFTPPTVRNSHWPTTSLDRFILAKLEEKGLQPAAQVDRRMLIRRITFDLTGLPPTREEVQAFLADSTPDAYRRVVDRLLASPAYGERWGRHWLDVARYADSNGLDENVAHGNAWRYRDYVVSSFNRDQSFEQFVREQVAGDLLSAASERQRRERLIATGFLSLGPKVLAEVDERKMELDIVDEQIDTLGKAFLGMTFGCARCHDHKFDPISLEDYTGLAGIFLSTRTMEHFRKVAKWHENDIGTVHDLARKKEHEAKIAQLKAEIQQRIKSAFEELRKSQKKLSLLKNPESVFDPKSKADLARLRAELAKREKEAPVIPTAMGVSESKITDAPLMKRGNHLRPGKLIPRRFPVVLAGEKQSALPAKHSGRLELARWMTDPKNPLTARVLVNRVWRWHFGQGLVRSVDNFGLLGEKPTHPELLDWLTIRFIESGWSIKALHREILLSKTYQISSVHDERAVAVDPDNRLYSRFNLQRLEAEAIRDNLLAVSGGLDRSMGGSLLHVANRGYLFDHTSKDLTKYDSPRRSLYLPVIRNNLYDVFGLFDTTDATVSGGDRATTTVATQALFMMNSELVRQSAERLAESTLKQPETSRLDWLYETAYARRPTAQEKDRATVVLSRFEQTLSKTDVDAASRQRAAWTWYCHALLASNEFIYVN